MGVVSRSLCGVSLCWCSTHAFHSQSFDLNSMDRLSPLHKAILTIGVARVIIRRRRSSSRKRRFVAVDETETSTEGGVSTVQSSSARTEIDSTLRKLSETGVPLQFPDSLEILFDFTLFDVENEVGSRQSAESGQSSLLDQRLHQLVMIGDTDRLMKFGDHLTHRLVQRVMGESELIYWKIILVIKQLCNLTNTTTATNETHITAAIATTTTSASSSSSSSQRHLDHRHHHHHHHHGSSNVTSYARWVLESINDALGTIGGMDLNLMNTRHFRAYERLGNCRNQCRTMM